MMSFKKFVLMESKKEVVSGFIKIVDGAKERLIKIDDPEKLDDLKKKIKDEIETEIEKFISKFDSKNVLWDESFIDDEKIIDDISEFLKSLKIKSKIFDLYLESGLDNKKKEKFIEELDFVSDKDETDKDVEDNAKKNAKDDDEFEKEVEKEIEAEKKQPKKNKKILLGIIEKEHDGEVTEAYIGETDLKEKEIEGLEYRDDVSSSIQNMRLLKTPSAISKRIKELGGTVVYYYDEKKKENEEEFWKIVKV